MNQTVTIAKAVQATITSIELVAIINDLREEGKAELRHDNFMTKIEKHPGIDSPKFLGQYKDITGRTLKCYHTPKREAELMVMSESMEVQTCVYDRMTALEQQKAVEAPRESRIQVEAACALIAHVADRLKFAPSSKLGCYQKIKQRIGMPRLLPAYAIDAPSDSTAGSSEPTKSLKALIADFGLPLSSIKLNQILIEKGFLKERERPSSKGGTKRCKVIVNLEYGKNVTHPTSPRETQPLWYPSKFKALLDLVLPQDAPC